MTASAFEPAGPEETVGGIQEAGFGQAERCWRSAGWLEAIDDKGLRLLSGELPVGHDGHNRSRSHGIAPDAERTSCSIWCSGKMASMAKLEHSLWAGA